MLAELYVENFALIESLQIEFDSGLNIISGETGAGKSLLTDAVGLLVGSRSDRNMIRTGATRALVEATFTGPFSAALQTQLDEDDRQEDSLVISREMNREGKNVCRLNGRRIPLGRLTAIGLYLLNQHDQLEHAELLQPRYQLELLDRFGGEALLAAREELARAYTAWSAAKKLVEQMESRQQEREQRLDYLRYQAAELDDLQIMAGEGTALAQEIELLHNSSTLYERALAAYTALYGGEEGNAAEAIYEAKGELETLLRFDPSLQSLHDGLAELYYRLEDVAGSIQQYAEAIDSDPQRLEELENRRALLQRVAKKHHTDADGLVALRATIAEEIETLETLDQRAGTAAADEAEAQAALTAAVAALTAGRQAAATRLSTKIVTELHELMLPNAQFEIAFHPVAVSALGGDEIDYMITLNRGEELRPLAQVASGGEMSRILLAIKVILARMDHVPTIIFDEIDSGMGGRTAAKIGEKLYQLAGDLQILAVTHSPLVAACAEHHYYIEKIESEGRMRVTIRRLADDEVAAEIARMLSGDGQSAVSLSQARELIARSRTVSR